MSMSLICRSLIGSSPGKPMGFASAILTNSCVATETLCPGGSPRKRGCCLFLKSSIILSALILIVLVQMTLMSLVFSVTVTCPHGPSGLNRRVGRTGVGSSILCILLWLAVCLLLWSCSQVTKAVNVRSLLLACPASSMTPRELWCPAISIITNRPGDRDFIAAGCDIINLCSSPWRLWYSSQAE